jgi:hypothetical protein
MGDYESSNHELFNVEDIKDICLSTRTMYLLESYACYIHTENSIISPVKHQTTCVRIVEESAWQELIRDEPHHLIILKLLLCFHIILVFHAVFLFKEILC